MSKQLRTFDDLSRATKFRICKKIRKRVEISESDGEQSSQEEAFTSSPSSSRNPSPSIREDDFYFDIGATDFCESRGRDSSDDSSDSEVSDNVSSPENSSSGSVSSFDESEDEDIDEDDENVIDDVNQPIYEGAPITIIESFVAISTLVSRHKISGVLLLSILELVSLHCVKPHKCFNTLYKFKHFLKNTELPLQRHYYCDQCLTKYNTEFCLKCNSKQFMSYFIRIPIISQLEKMYKRPSFTKLLNHKSTREKINIQNYEDIYDGEIYKNLSEVFLNNPSNLSLMWNTDGVSIFKSSKFNIWPFYFIINQLPYEERFKKENVIFAGLWFGNKKPISNMYLLSFKEELESLFRGIYFNINNTKTLVKGIIICGTCDLPAKSLFLNLKNFNGDYGCSICKIRTKRVDNVQTYPFRDDLEIRTIEETREFAKLAVTSRKSIFGVKGPSALDLIVQDYIQTTAIDIMHCAFEGVAKKLLKIWFDSEYRSHQASISKFTNIINQRIRLLKPPSFIARIPRQISELSHFKASEFKSFLFYYSLPLFSDIMPEQYFNHLILLVLGLTLLNKSSVSEENVDEASKALREFVSRFKVLYGAKNMTCNVHLLLHLPDTVRKFGPLWVTSCFPFENLNGILKNFVHGTKYAHLQIYSSISNFMFITELKEKYLINNSDVYKFCKILEKSGTHRRRLMKLYENTFAVGRLKLRKNINSIKNILNIEVGEIQIYHEFSRLLKKSSIYESSDYARTKKTNSSYCKYNDNGVEKIGCIKSFIKICSHEDEESCEDCKYYVIMNACEVQPIFSSSVTETYINNIFSCRVGITFSCVDINHLQSVCFSVLVNNFQYVIEPPNNKESE